MKAFIFVALALAFSAVSFADESLIAQEKITNIPKGSFWFGYDFTKDPISTGGVRIELSGNYCGPTYIGGVVYTSSADQASWTNASKNTKGLWAIKENSLHKLKVLVNQPKFKTADCSIKVYASDLVGSANEDTFIGVIEYAGGYDPNLMIPLYPARMVKSFRVAIPEYCAGIEVLEAGVQIEGTFEKGKMLDKGLHTYAVNDGHGLVVGGIAMKLNGPAKSCTIPIFVKD